MASALVRRRGTARATHSRPPAGLRERKKARLRQQIIDTSIKLFRKYGYESTRIDDIVQMLNSALSNEASTGERLRRLYVSMAREVEADRQLWQAVVLSGAMDPVRSANVREPEEAAARLLREILTQGQKRKEVTRDLPVLHMAQFMEGLYNTVVRQWAVDLTGPHKLTDRVRNAVELFLRGIQP